MKIRCPTCLNTFIGSSIYVDNATELTLSGTIATEYCPRCGYAFNPYKDGVYNVKDGIPTMIRTLSGLELNAKSKKRVKGVNFNNIKDEEELLEKSRWIDIGLFNIIKEWLANGIAFVTIIVALSTYVQKVKDEPLSHREIMVQQATMMPDSVKTSFLNSFKVFRTDSSIVKVRDDRDLDVNKLRKANDEKKKIRRKKK